jgi:hypothetical protein
MKPAAVVVALTVLQAAPSRAGAQQEPAVIPTGTYASQQAVSSRARMRPANRYMRVTTTSLVLHRVSVSGEETRVTSRYCTVEQEPLGRVRTTLGSAFVNAIPAWEVTAEVNGPAGGPWSVTLPVHTVVIGAELSDPRRDPLPMDVDDERVIDGDGDGQPGVTVEVEGFVDGQVYLVQRLVRGLRGTLMPNGHMSGYVIGSSDQEVVGASNTVLRAFTPRFHQEPEESLHTFLWRPVPDGSTCPDVLALRDDLFGAD